MKRSTFWAAFILLLAGLSAAAYLLSQRQDTVRIGYLKIAAHLPLFVADSEGFLRGRGFNIKLVPFSSSTHILDALEAKQIEVGYELSADLVFRAHAEDPDLLRVYQAGVSTGESPIDSLVVRVGSTIADVSGLAGRVVGVFPGPTASAMFRLYLRRTLSNPSTWPEIRIILPFNQLNALETGQVDALFTYEPIPTIAVNKGLGTELVRGPVESPQGLNLDPWIGGLGVMRKGFLDQKSKQATYVRDAIYKAFDRVKKADAEPRMKILPRYVDTLKNEDIATLQRVRLTEHWKLSEIEIQRVAALIDLYVTEGVIPEKPDLSQLLAKPGDFSR